MFVKDIDTIVVSDRRKVIPMNQHKVKKMKRERELNAKRPGGKRRFQIRNKENNDN